MKKTESFVAYKHTEKKWAKDLKLHGRLKLSSYDYYHDIESSQVGIEDPLEGVGIVDLTGFYPAETPDAQTTVFTGETVNDGFTLLNAAGRARGLKGRALVVEAIRETMGIDLSNCNIHVSQTHIEHRCPPLYIYSMTYSSTPGIFDCPEQGQKYDAVVKIPDWRRLAKAIVLSAPESLARVHGASVIYEPRIVHASQGNLDNSPFRKNTSFAWQKEVRLVFEPRGEMKKHIFVEGKRIKKSLQGG